MSDRILFAGTLKFGLKNDPREVLGLQRLLNAMPLSLGVRTSAVEENGIIGPAIDNLIRKFQRVVIGPGAVTGRVTPNGKTQWHLNRVATYLRGFSQPLVIDSLTMYCPHGGMISAKSLSNRPVLKTSDKTVISGCPFDHPCTHVKWLGAPSSIVTDQTPGMCLNASNLPQGAVMLTDYWTIPIYQGPDFDSESEDDFDKD